MSGSQFCASGHGLARLHLLAAYCQAARRDLPHPGRRWAAAIRCSRAGDVGSNAWIRPRRDPRLFPRGLDRGLHQRRQAGRPRTAAPVRRPQRSLWGTRMNMATTTFFRLLKDADKGAALAEAIGSVRGGRPEPRVFDVDPVSFRKVPTTPFAYWVSEHAPDLFVDAAAVRGRRPRRSSLASQTSDDFRFVRAWWEVLAEQGPRWPQWSRVVGDLRRSSNGAGQRIGRGEALGSVCQREASTLLSSPMCILWTAPARGRFAQIVEYVNAHYPYLKGNAHRMRRTDSEFYFRPGLTWPIENRLGFKPRRCQSGAVFAHVGSCGFWRGSVI